MATKQKLGSKKLVPQPTPDPSSNNFEGSDRKYEDLFFSQEDQISGPELSTGVQESFIIPTSSISSVSENSNRPNMAQLQTLLENLDAFSKIMDELNSIPQLADNLAEVKLKLDAFLRYCQVNYWRKNIPHL